MIAAASEYPAAILSAMGVEVVAPESSDPVDLILVDGAVEDLPQSMIDRLAAGGRLATGLVDGSVTRLAAGRKNGNHFGLRVLGDAGIPRLANFTRPRAFTF